MYEADWVRLVVSPSNEEEFQGLVEEECGARGGYVCVVCGKRHLTRRDFCPKVWGYSLPFCRGCCATPLVSRAAYRELLEALSTCAGAKTLPVGAE